MEPIVPSADTNTETPSATTTKGTSRKPRGRPKSKFDEKERAMIVEMAKLGMRHTIIAKAVDTSANTLRKHCAKELFDGTLEADKAVLTTLHDMATSKRCPSATIFWAKTRCAYKSDGLNTADDLPDPQAKTPKPSKSPRNGEDPDSTPPKVSALTNLTVYNNEGEPNADY